MSLALACVYLTKSLQQRLHITGFFGNVLPASQLITWFFKSLSKQKLILTHLRHVQPAPLAASQTEKAYTPCCIGLPIDRAFIHMLM